jgi:Spy/CpxP family protein refolding chaperone
MTAIRDQTDSKIRAVLTADQRKKFDSLLVEQKSRRGRRA